MIFYKAFFSRVKLYFLVLVHRVKLYFLVLVHMFTIFPANICLDEDVMKTSWRRLSSSFSEDVLIKTNIFTLVIRLQNTSSGRLDQDQYKTSSRHLANTSSKLLQDVCKNVFKTSSRRLQDIFKISCKVAFKMFWRRIIRLNCLPSSKICLGHTS